MRRDAVVLRFFANMSAGSLENLDFLATIFLCIELIGNKDLFC